MTIRELQEGFQLVTQNYDQPGILTSDVIFYWLNKAYVKLVETYYSNDKESFEQTQNITDILKNLIVEVTITPAVPIDIYGVQLFKCTLPAGYMHALNERVTLDIPNPNDPGTLITKESSVVDASSSTLNSLLTDPYSAHRVHYESAEPLRLFTDTSVDLYTDGNYEVTEYYLRYLKTPIILVLPAKDSPDAEFTELPSNNHNDLIVLASKMYADSIKGNEPPDRQKELNAIKGKLIQTK